MPKKNEANDPVVKTLFEAVRQNILWDGTALQQFDEAWPLLAELIDERMLVHEAFEEMDRRKIRQADERQKNIIAATKAAAVALEQATKRKNREGRSLALDLEDQIERAVQLAAANDPPPPEAETPEARLERKITARFTSQD